MLKKLNSAAFFLLLLLRVGSAYYLPGTYPREFRQGEPLFGESFRGLLFDIDICMIDAVLFLHH